MASVKKENGSGSASPLWRSSMAKSIVRAIESRRRSGLEAPKAKTKLLQPFAQANGRVLAHAPCGKASCAPM